IHLELSLESHGLTLVKMDIGDVRRAHHAEVFLFRFGLEKAGDQTLEHLLPDVAGEVAANQRSGRLARPKCRQLHLVLIRFCDLAGLGLECLDGNRDFKLELATFYECQCGSTSEGKIPKLQSIRSGYVYFASAPSSARANSS